MMANIDWIMKQILEIMDSHFVKIVGRFGEMKKGVKKTNRRMGRPLHHLRQRYLA